jgi:hypothetical protein
MVILILRLADEFTKCYRLIRRLTENGGRTQEYGFLIGFYCRVWINGKEIGDHRAGGDGDIMPERRVLHSGQSSCTSTVRYSGLLRTRVDSLYGTSGSLKVYKPTIEYVVTWYRYE